MKRTMILGAVLALAVALPGVALAASFSEHGTEKIVRGQFAGCQSVAQGCLTLKGGVHGTPISGALEATMTVDWSSGGTCGTAGGVVILSNTAGDALNLVTSGRLCKRGALFVYSGSWSIQAGSGKYATAGIGRGKMSLRELPSHLVQAAILGRFGMGDRPNP
jgi:hypothetical protein